jgi:glucan phosphoethanolaminetransferase (alkaline phosphatase superfamily)
MLDQLLRSRGVASETLLVFVSDHGEEFREHGGLGHGFQLFE